MTITTGYRFKGVVRVTVREADGTIVRDRTIHNTETNFMRSACAQWLAGTATTASLPPPTQIGAGNGTPPYGQTGPLPTDTALWSPIAGTQRQCDSIQVSQGYYAQFTLNYLQSDPAGYYNELGLFDAAGNMWAHCVINDYKSAQQTLTVQWMVYMVNDTTNTAATVTNFCRSAFAQWLTGTSTATLPPPNAIQLGTGIGTPQVGDTALWTPAPGTTKACDAIYVSQSYNVQFAVTYLSTDPTGTFTEAGWVDANGNLWVHGTIAAYKSGSNLLSIVGQVGIVGD